MPWSTNLKSEPRFSLAIGTTFWGKTEYYFSEQVLCILKSTKSLLGRRCTAIVSWENATVEIPFLLLRCFFCTDKLRSGRAPSWLWPWALTKSWFYSRSCYFCSSWRNLSPDCVLSRNHNHTTNKPWWLYCLSYFLEVYHEITSVTIRFLHVGEQLSRWRIYHGPKRLMQGFFWLVVGYVLFSCALGWVAAAFTKVGVW